MDKFTLRVDASNCLVIESQADSYWEAFYLTELICQAIGVPFPWYRIAYHRGIRSYLLHWIEGIFDKDWDIHRTSFCVGSTKDLIIPIGDLDSFKLLLEITIEDYKQSTRSL